MKRRKRGGGGKGIDFIEEKERKNSRKLYSFGLCSSTTKKYATPKRNRMQLVQRGVFQKLVPDPPKEMREEIELMVEEHVENCRNKPPVEGEHKLVVKKIIKFLRYGRPKKL